MAPTIGESSARRELQQGLCEDTELGAGSEAALRVRQSVPFSCLRAPVATRTPFSEGGDAPGRVHTGILSMQGVLGAESSLGISLSTLGGMAAFPGAGATRAALPHQGRAALTQCFLQIPGPQTP